MELITNQTFTNESIIFDGFHFVGCSFRDCIVVISDSNFAFDRCSFEQSTFHVQPDSPAYHMLKPVCENAGNFWADVYKGSRAHAAGAEK
ncbi:hypothetical protein PA598K_06916 [Paenibacillus sp. 598K]|uniref:hypothetical protein n=1 Tax=Paenibacillus sp. 598K TaxID=1117987 RepID=UPI000FF90534|nr:hypothetical protein [Paenibacillus sp. 598K]GBF78290.1 hypothetical protein PA598K_06916 [Paenibacillus sp. 598K]